MINPVERLWKLTDENDRTYGGCQWGPGVTVTTRGNGELCTAAFTHWYRSPELAVLMNPVHGNFNPATMHLWEGAGEAGRDDGTKVGCVRGTTLRRVPVPCVTLEQRVRFAILCALAVYQETSFVEWANGWLSGADRSRKAACAAAAAARAPRAAAVWAALAAAWAVTAWAAEAAEAAARAAHLDLVALAQRAIAEEKA